MVVADHAIFFHDYTEIDQPIVGGKCASLGAMTKAGFPVPPGFAVTTHAFADSMGRDHVGPHLHSHLDALDVSDLHALSEAAALCRQMVLDAGPSEAAEAVIRAGYRQLCEDTGVDDVAVAVRSSATAEDQPDASFAGQQDTYLWIRGADNVVNHVVRCWASLYTDRAIAYRHENGYPHADVAMSVAVQQMVLPKAAGVAFTLNPTNGDRSTIVIDSSFGLGESVVSGIVTPDNYMIDKVIFEITKRTVSAKEVECRVEGGKVVERPLDADRSCEPSLSDAEIKSIARLARQAEKYFGRPQDVEWAVTIDADGEHIVHLLQSRPETVWSNKPRQVSQGVHTGVEGVVSNLLKPVQVKQ
ncbi:MAG: PEP/pyruvate-binding domain-containing protein [Ilumatobacteraceae bacterium]